MSLDVTVSGIHANSYADLIEADAFFSIHPIFHQSWNQLSDADKEFWLKTGTSRLDYLREWDGCVAVSSQNREFPRDIGDARFPAKEIHDRVKEAVYTIIMILFNEQNTTTGAVETRTEESVSALNGLVDVKYQERSHSNDLELLSGVSMNTVFSLMRPWWAGRKAVR